MIDRYVCNATELCGDLKNDCSHAQPHIVTRCSCCGTWCGDSNGLCHEGLCGHKKDLWFEIFKKQGRPKCNIKVEAKNGKES